MNKRKQLIEAIFEIINETAFKDEAVKWLKRYLKYKDVELDYDKNHITISRNGVLKFSILLIELN